MPGLRERLRRRIDDSNGPGLLGYAMMLVVLGGIILIAFLFFGPQTNRVLETISPAV